MTYKIVRDAEGEVVGFGLNDGNYEPTIKDGEVLSIESNSIAAPLIKLFTDKAIALKSAQDAATATAKASGLAKLAALGFTEAEIAAW